MKLQTVRFKSDVILLLRYLVMSLKQAHHSNWLEFMHVLTYFVSTEETTEVFHKYGCIVSTELSLYLTKSKLSEKTE